jgi:hypothetical protein
MKKRILFVDDDPQRHIIFWQYYGQHELAQCTLPDLAITLLKSNTFDELWLDHDMGEITHSSPIGSAKIIIDSKPIVNWIVENKKPSDIPYIRIHSWNFQAAEWMKHALINAGFSVNYIPFNLKKKDI